MRTGLADGDAADRIDGVEDLHRNRPRLGGAEGERGAVGDAVAVGREEAQVDVGERTVHQAVEVERTVDATAEPPLVDDLQVGVDRPVAIGDRPQLAVVSASAPRRRRRKRGKRRASRW